MCVCSARQRCVSVGYICICNWKKNESICVYFWASFQLICQAQTHRYLRCNCRMRFYESHIACLSCLPPSTLSISLPPSPCVLLSFILISLTFSLLFFVCLLRISLIFRCLLLNFARSTLLLSLFCSLSAVFLGLTARRLISSSSLELQVALIGNMHRSSSQTKETARHTWARINDAWTRDSPRLNSTLLHLSCILNSA